MIFNLFFITVKLIMIYVFTDGACSNNGKINAKAGIGIYFKDNDPRNVSRRIQGKQTNNTAELLAVIEVFSILKNEISSNEEIHIYSDSEYTIRCCGDYGEKSEKRQWKNKQGYIPNHKLVQEIYELFKFNPNVKIHYIAAHTGLTDELSKGNEGADRLANLSINSNNLSNVSKKQKYYLTIPYLQKDIGKKLGAKWDPKKKKWFYDGLTTDENFKKLNELF